VTTALAVSAPGLADLCAAELRALGIPVERVDEAGVTFEATPDALARAHVGSAIASRIIMRMSQFEARGFAELERHAKRVPWGQVLTSGRPVRLRVTSRKSKLYHTDAIAERLWPAIIAGGGAPDYAPVAADEDDDATGSDEAQLLVVRVHRDVVTISADASGALLHRRGWRLASAKAPMRETLAAALLAAAGYDGRGPLVDPLAGSGTIGIEAARRARGLPPGLDRGFAFERWPAHDPAPLARVRDAARKAALAKAPSPIIVNDRDAGACDAIVANAERAGVKDDLDVRQGPASRLALPAGPGWLVTNPPYGKRITGGDDLRDLYASLGRAWRTAAPGWRVAMIGPAGMASAFGLPLDDVVGTRNGGLAVSFFVGDVPP
jgi:putative N6-adenine-specific DNA methylase